MTGEYKPHDHGHHLHDDLIEDVEEIRHELPSFSHFPHANTKCDEEPNQTLQHRREKV